MGDGDSGQKRRQRRGHRRVTQSGEPAGLLSPSTLIELACRRPCVAQAGRNLARGACRDGVGDGAVSKTRQHECATEAGPTRCRLESAKPCMLHVAEGLRPHQAQSVQRVERGSHKSQQAEPRS